MKPTKMPVFQEKASESLAFCGAATTALTVVILAVNLTYSINLPSLIAVLSILFLTMFATVPIVIGNFVGFGKQPVINYVYAAFYSLALIVMHHVAYDYISLWYTTGIEEATRIDVQYIPMAIIFGWFGLLASVFVGVLRGMSNARIANAEALELMRNYILQHGGYPIKRGMRLHFSYGTFIGVQQ